MVEFLKPDFMTVEEITLQILDEIQNTLNSVIEKKTLKSVMVSNDSTSKSFTSTARQFKTNLC